MGEIIPPAPVTPFSFDGQPVRIVTRDGEPWFVLADVCKVLEFRDGPTAVRGLDDDEKATQIVCTPGGNQSATIISESGLYSLVLTSRRPEAKRFKRWITGEVLPAIRKTGGYGPPAVNLDDPAFLRGALLSYTEEVIALESAVAEKDAALTSAAPEDALLGEVIQHKTPVVSLKSGRAITTSRDVADAFGKNHRDVLRSIDDLLGAGAPPRNFAQGSYPLPTTGMQVHRQYEMDRDGFTLLAMGFTGSQALKFKLAYIAEFNRMEATLNAPPACTLAGWPMTSGYWLIRC